MSRGGVARVDEPRWLPPAAAAVVTVVALALVGWYLWRVLAADPYRNIIPGIWLALARDLADGLFYRPILSEAGYGGTRYFPLHFVVIAAFLKIGVPAGWAWVLAAAVSAATLTSGLFVACRALRMPAVPAGVFAIAGLVPYFMLQTLVELRADVLAAGLNVWGIALLLPGWRGDTARMRVVPGAVAFALAFATKITSLAVPAAVVVALALTGRRAAAGRLLAATAAGVSVVLGAIIGLSHGSALENWRASLFAGTGAAGTLDVLASGAFIPRLLQSRFLVVLGLVTTGALVAAWRTPRAHERVPGLRWLATLLLAATAASMAVTLSSPGAVPNNQAVEWIAMSILALAMTTRMAPWTARPLSFLVAALAIWAAAQAAWHVRGDAADAGWAAVRRAVLDRIAREPGAVFTESAEWSVLAGRPPILIDPFMFRIVAQARPEVSRHLADRIANREFALLVLQEHPGTPRGRVWFDTVDLGRPIADEILRAYELERRIAADVWLFVPTRQ